MKDEALLRFECRIRVTTTYPDGSTTTVLHTYTLEGPRDAAETWCDNKATQFY